MISNRKSTIILEYFLIDSDFGIRPGNNCKCFDVTIKDMVAVKKDMSIQGAKVVTDQQ